jgi:hypothetical protein
MTNSRTASFIVPIVDPRFLQDSFFDLACSETVLQHMNKELALRYISEFMRAVKREGLVLFQAL